MPIKIYNASARSKESEELAWLCGGVWELPPQVKALERWLMRRGVKLRKGDYIADVGFAPRGDAFGGGSVVNQRMMRIMLKAGITLFLSEYPPSRK